MKKLLSAICVTCFFTCITVFSFAQSSKKEGSGPKWVCNDGYWNVVSNIHTPKLSTIYFYNNKKELLYSERVEGVVINVKKRKVKMNLKKALDKSLIAFNKNQHAAENEMLVINLIKK